MVSPLAVVSGLRGRQVEAVAVANEPPPRAQLELIRWRQFASRYTNATRSPSRGLALMRFVQIGTAVSPDFTMLVPRNGLMRREFLHAKQIQASSEASRVGSMRLIQIGAACRPVSESGPGGRCRLAAGRGGTARQAGWPVSGRARRAPLLEEGAHALL